MVLTISLLGLKRYSYEVTSHVWSLATSSLDGILCVLKTFLVNGEVISPSHLQKEHPISFMNDVLM